MARTIKHQIAIAGWAGTGTTSASKGVLDRLGDPWRIIRPASDMFRGMAVKRYPDMEIGEALFRFEQDAGKEPQIDQSCDHALAKIAAVEQCFIVDARLGAHFAPESLRVLLYCDDDIVRYERVAAREGISLSVAGNQTMNREMSAKTRYMILYGVAVESLNYDLRINTKETPTSDVVDQIVAKFYELTT
jgi:cytidylate kinase